MIFRAKSIFDPKKIIFLIIIIISIGTIAVSYNDTHETVSVKLYFIDSDMMRLLKVDAYMAKTTPQREASAVIRELIRGRDENPKIRRLICDDDKCLSVKLKKKTAYVNISGELSKNPPKTRDHEMLIVYQIVNSLTSVEGVENVRFTVDGSVKRDFAGFLDMRETFIPDYFV